MQTEMQVKGLEGLSQQMQAYPLYFTKEMAQAVGTALLVLHEGVEPYPPKPPTSTYDRTHTLDRSLGVIGDTHNIYNIKRVGANGFVGRFGTNLKYAPRVIGPVGVQREPFTGYWWRLEQVAEKQHAKVIQVFTTLADRLTAFLAAKSA